MIGSRSAAVRLLALAFALGALIGGAATMLAERGSHPAERREGRQGYLERLSAEVGLSTTQEAAISQVLERHEPAMDSIWASVRVQFETHRQSARQDIRAVLTPEQLVKYDAMLARRDSARRDRESKHGKK